MCPSTLNPGSVHRSSLTWRSLLAVLLVGGVVSALARLIFRWFLADPVVNTEHLLMSCWGFLLLVQVFLCLWAWLTPRPASRPLSKRRIRSRDAMCVTFGVGGLPLTVFALLLLSRLLDRHGLGQLGTEPFHPGEPLWMSLLQVLAAISVLWMLLGIPLKITALVLYGGWRDGFVLGLAHLAILTNSCLAVVFVGVRVI